MDGEQRWSNLFAVGSSCLPRCGRTPINGTIQSTIPMNLLGDLRRMPNFRQAPRVIYKIPCCSSGDGDFGDTQCAVQVYECLRIKSWYHGDNIAAVEFKDHIKINLTIYYFEVSIPAYFRFDYDWWKTIASQLHCVLFKNNIDIFANIAGTVVTISPHFIKAPMGLLPDRLNCGYACAGNAGNVFPVTTGERSRHASRHVRHARAVMHTGIAN